MIGDGRFTQLSWWDLQVRPRSAICATCRHRQLKSPADRQAFSTYRAASIMMKIAVVGATGPTGVHLVTDPAAQSKAATSSTTASGCPAIRCT